MQGILACLMFALTRFRPIGADMCSVIAAKMLERRAVPRGPTRKVSRACKGYSERPIVRLPAALFGALVIQLLKIFTFPLPPIPSLLFLSSFPSLHHFGDTNTTSPLRLLPLDSGYSQMHIQETSDLPTSFFRYQMRVSRHPEAQRQTESAQRVDPERRRGTP